MRIKDKLAIILGLIGALLVFFAGSLAWNARQIAGQVQAIAPVIDRLKTAGEVRTRFYEQMHMLVHYFAYHEEQGRVRYEALRGNILALLKNAPSARATGGPAAGGARDNEIEKTYGRLTEAIDRAIAARKQGREAAFPGETVEPLMDAFLQAIEQDIVLRTEEIEAGYDRIIMGLGGVPWLGERYLRRIEGAQLSIRYFFAVDGLSWSMNRQVHALVGYLMTGREQNLRDFDAAGAEALNALAESRRIIAAQIGLGVAGEDEEYAEVGDLEREYKGTLLLAREAAALKKGGMAGQAFALLENKLKRRVDGRLLPRIGRIIDGSREEIAGVNRAMLKAVFTAALAALAVMLLCVLGLFIAARRLVRTLVDDIYRLKTGAEIVGSGDLDHRIAVRSSDELGALAEAFNAMTASLKERDEELKAFVFSLSHDLRSPLVNLKGFSRELARTLHEVEALLGREGAGLTEADRTRLLAALQQEIPPMLGFIGSASDRMDELVNGVLKLARAGQTPMRPELIDMPALVQAALRPLEGRISAQRITVSVGTLPRVFADRQALEQILGSLFDNAVKYLVAGRAGRVEISGIRRSQDTVFHVRDNGRGIAAEDLRKAFEMFRRVGRQDVPGGGMGLACARTLVRRHGGRIWCESEPGVGSTFSFAIPHPPAPRNAFTV